MVDDGLVLRIGCGVTIEQLCVLRQFSDEMSGDLHPMFAGVTLTETHGMD